MFGALKDIGTFHVLEAVSAAVSQLVGWLVGTVGSTYVSRAVWAVNPETETSGLKVRQLGRGLPETAKSTNIFAFNVMMVSGAAYGSCDLVSRIFDVCYGPISCV